MITKCHICNATINEDGTVENCAGECDRQFDLDYAADRELDFSQDIIPTIMVSDVYDEGEEYEGDISDDYWED